MPLLKYFCGNPLVSEFVEGVDEVHYRDTIRLIAGRCHALERLTFVSSDSTFDLSVSSYAIVRDDEGSYVGEVIVEDDGQLETRTSRLSSSSGWTSAKYDNI